MPAAKACPPTATCRLEMAEDVEVRALFRTHVLRLSLDGDAPVRVELSPPDDRGLDVSVKTVAQQAGSGAVLSQ